MSRTWMVSHTCMIPDKQYKWNPLIPCDILIHSITPICLHGHITECLCTELELIC